MKDVSLILPEQKYVQSFYEMLCVFYGAGFTSESAPDIQKYDDWRHTIIAEYHGRSKGIGLPEGYVPDTTYWLLKGEQVIGMGVIRHRLTQALAQYGGHIGYMMHPDYHGKGYGTIQLFLLLGEASKLGLEEVLVSCDVLNHGSRRVIEKNGGRISGPHRVEAGGVERSIYRFWVRTR